MAFPIAAAITAAATLASSGIGAASQGNMNKKNRAFQQEMWQKDADQNIAQWNMQNKYNEGMWEKQKTYNQNVWEQQNNYDSPQAQMERFRMAGLNPNLIYGQNNMGGTLDAAQNTSSAAIPGRNTSPVQGKAPEFDLASGIFAYMDFKTKALQNDNLEAQNEAIKAGIARTYADTDAIRSGIGLKNQLLGYRTEANPLGLDALRLKNRQTEQAYEKKEQYYEMDSARMEQWLRYNKAQIGRMTQQNMTDAKQRELMDTEINLNKMGIGKGSPWWLRLMGQKISEMETSPKDTPLSPGSKIKLHDDKTWDNWGSFKMPWDK